MASKQLVRDLTNAIINLERRVAVMDGHLADMVATQEMWQFDDVTTRREELAYLLDAAREMLVEARGGESDRLVTMRPIWQGDGNRLSVRTYTGRPIA